MKRFNLAFLIISALLIIGCKDEVKKAETESQPENTFTEFNHEAGEIAASFNDPKLDSLFASYIELKTALINTDAAASAQSASELLTAYSNLGVDEEVFTRAMKMVETKDIEVQRAVFSEVTTDIENLLSEAISSGAIYKQFCPMAFNNKGAFWLSESDEIANPYFGDKMYRCGVVKEKIE